MSVTADLVDFARTSGAISSVYKGDGIALTWDSGRSWQHIWDTKDSRRPQAFYGESGSSPVEWCNRFVSFGVGYALSWSGGSSCPVGWGVSRDLVRMSRLR